MPSHNKKSLFLSSVLTKITFAGLVIFLFFVPRFADFYNSVSSVLMRGEVVPKNFIIISTYTAEIPALAICILLERLLTNIKNNDVFINANVKLLRMMSYCCFFAGIVFAIFTYYQPVAFFIFFACEFIGLILRVIKNVFEKAVELREENDYTI